VLSCNSRVLKELQDKIMKEKETIDLSKRQFYYMSVFIVGFR
jgi:hypothetical protein